MRITGDHICEALSTVPGITHAPEVLAGVIVVIGICLTLPPVRMPLSPYRLRDILMPFVCDGWPHSIP